MRPVDRAPSAKDIHIPLSDLDTLENAGWPHRNGFFFLYLKLYFPGLNVYFYIHCLGYFYFSVSKLENASVLLFLKILLDYPESLTIPYNCESLGFSKKC